nr:hypothetical protein [Tanacetum cinerariifolium]
MTSIAQQIELENALVTPENRRVINKCNMRINLGMKPKEPTYQVELDALALSTCYPAFLITDTRVYGVIIPEVMMNQGLLDSVAYKTYFAIASGAKPPKSRKSQKKSDSAISSEESPSKKKSAKAKKVVVINLKPTKKKAPFKADSGKGLNVLLEVTLSKDTQLKEATKRSKKDFHTSHASGLGNGTDFESGVPNEQHRKTSGIDEGTSTKPGVFDVPNYDSECEEDSWGDSGEEDNDDENDFEEDSFNNPNLRSGLERALLVFSIFL